MPTTDELKYAAAEWLSSRRCYPISVEVHLASTIADVCGINELGRLIEVEVKRSISDLRNDDRKWAKHAFIRKLREEAKQAGRVPEKADYHVPSRFYFAIPEQIEEKAKKAIKEKFPYAGVLRISVHDLPGYYRPIARVTKPATWIHFCKADDQVLDAFHRPMTWRLLSSLRRSAAESKPTPCPKSPS